MKSGLQILEDLKNDGVCTVEEEDDPEESERLRGIIIFVFPKISL